MRIGEIAVISAITEKKDTFIEAVCQKLERPNEKVCFGRLKINEQLALHFYGISVDGDYSSISWDLLSAKILGYVIIFGWNDYESLQKIKLVIDYFSDRFTVPIIVVADVEDESNIPLPKEFCQNGGISMTNSNRLLFSQISDPASSKKVIATIIDILLEKM